MRGDGAHGTPSSRRHGDAELNGAVRRSNRGRAMGERRARFARGQEEERAEHKPPGSVSWLVLSPFLLLPQPAGRPAPTLPHREPPRLRVSAMMVSRALRPLHPGEFFIPPGERSSWRTPVKNCRESAGYLSKPYP